MSLSQSLTSSVSAGFHCLRSAARAVVVALRSWGVSLGNSASGGRLQDALSVVDPLNATMLRAEADARAATAWALASRVSRGDCGNDMPWASLGQQANVTRLPFDHCVGRPAGGQEGARGPGMDFLTG